MTAVAKLLPCPFCGRSNLIISRMHGTGDRYVVCQTPECKTCGPSGDAREGAITTWNRRAALAPASPATGDDPCIECGADPGEACYPNCCTAPQPAAAQRWPSSEPDYTTLFNAIAAATSNYAGIGVNVSVSKFLEAIAAVPQPQEAPAQHHDPEDSRPCYVCGQRADAHQMVPGPRGGMKRGECPATPPAHGDGEGDKSEMAG